MLISSGMDMTMRVKNYVIFFISLSLGERAHDLCKSMIEMISAMQSVPKEINEYARVKPGLSHLDPICFKVWVD